MLEYLVAAFREKHNGSFKSLIREMLLSRTWRQSSQRLQSDLKDPAKDPPHDHPAPSSTAHDIDPNNRLLWRANPRRMEAEAVIDSIQFVCDRINLDTPNKATVPTFKVGNQGSTSDLEIPDETLKHRAVFWPVFRKDVPISMDTLGIFDFPPATTPRGTREVTRVPAQSLALLNNPFVIDSARSLQKSLLNDASLINDRDRIGVLYKKLYSRAPTSAEQTRALEFLKQFSEELEQTAAAKPKAVQSVSWNRLCHTLLISNEFIVIP